MPSGPMPPLKDARTRGVGAARIRLRGQRVDAVKVEVGDVDELAVRRERDAVGEGKAACDPLDLEAAVAVVDVVDVADGVDDGAAARVGEVRAALAVENQVDGAAERLAIELGGPWCNITLI